MMSDVRMSEVIAPCFFDVHRSIKKNEYTYYWLKGGRASTKSSFASIEIISGMMRDPEANAIVYRKIANTLADSVVQQCLWSTEALGVAEYWQHQKSPQELIYKPTGQRIIFRGTDSAEKSKSIKLAKGFFRFVWFEELSEFNNLEDIETIVRSVVRGHGHSIIFCTYNPPKSAKNWVNADAIQEQKNRLIHHSTYKDIPAEWLGPQFIEDAEATKKKDPLKYRWAYLGEATGTGGAVFTNLVLRDISCEEMREFDRIYNGLDWGYYPDPFAFNSVYYRSADKTLFVLCEYEANKKSNRDTATAIMQRCGVGYNDLILADSAEPKSIGDYRSYGLNCRAVKKGKGSVEYSMKWLQSLNAIIIDPKRCPKTAREFSEYEYDRDRHGEVIDGYPDAGNHHIDAIRYAMWPVWRVKGE